MVRYPLRERESLDDLLAMPVRLPEGGEAPLGALAEVSFAPGHAGLMRQDRQRILRVMARVDTRQVDVNAIYADLENGGLDSLKRHFPTLHIRTGQEEQEAMGGTRAQYADRTDRDLRTHRYPISFLFAAVHLHALYSHGLGRWNTCPSVTGISSLYGVAGGLGRGERRGSERQSAAA